MKKEIKYPFKYIKGVGPKRAELLAQQGIANYWDAIFNFPISYIDRSSKTSIIDLKNQLLKQSKITQTEFETLSDISIRNEHTLLLRVLTKKEYPLSRGKKLLSLVCGDGSGENIKINFWNFTDYYKSKYALGMYLIVSGKVVIGKSGLEISHPEIEIISESEKDNYESGKILPIYRLSDKLRKANINLNLIRSIVRHSFEMKISDIFERMPSYILEHFDLQNFSDAIFTTHFPESLSDLNKALERMKFDEIFIYLLKMKFSNSTNLLESVPINPRSKSARIIFESLPFKLTSAQKRVLNQIADDINKNIPMNRLLQGDVGSGKTITAFLSMLMVFDSGYQSLLIAPTEILAEQHYTNLLKLCSSMDNIRIELLTGSIKLKSKKKIVDSIQKGQVHIIIGTHALIQQSLEYNKLALIIIDEQHRFGVAQRNNLKTLAENSFKDKNIAPHILVMSATPIPRTLSLTLYSNLNISTIDELPKGRSPISTSIAFDSKIVEVHNFIKTEVRKGRQAYIVFPLIGKSDKLDLKSAEEQYTVLSQTVFKDLKCGILHGKLKAEEKENLMQDFKNKHIQILFTTTVIEVGVDVPNATIMTIMNAERFGLSQLHQLRGRVGRGQFKSYCILVTSDQYEFKVKRGLDKESEKISAVMRLKTMEKTTDGFEIAESDMKIRGPGDMTGTKQSGLPDFKFLNLVRDQKFIEETKVFVDKLIEEDPSLELKKNEEARAWLHRELKRSENFVETA